MESVSIDFARRDLTILSGTGVASGMCRLRTKGWKIGRAPARRKGETDIDECPVNIRPVERVVQGCTPPALQAYRIVKRRKEARDGLCQPPTSLGGSRNTHGCFENPRGKSGADRGHPWPPFCALQSCTLVRLGVYILVQPVRRDEYSLDIRLYPSHPYGELELVQFSILWSVSGTSLMPLLFRTKLSNPSGRNQSTLTPFILRVKELSPHYLSFCEAFATRPPIIFSFLSLHVSLIALPFNTLVLHLIVVTRLLTIPALEFATIWVGHALFFVAYAMFI